MDPRFVAPPLPPLAELFTPSVVLGLNLVPWLLALFTVAVFFLIWLYRIFQRLYQLQAVFKRVVLLVTVHKDSAEDKDRAQDSQESWRQDIAVAETLFSAIGGMRAERSLRALL